MMKLGFQPRDVIRQSLDFFFEKMSMCQMAVEKKNYSPPKLMVGQITHDQISGAFGYPATRVAGPSRRVVGPPVHRTEIFDLLEFYQWNQPNPKHFFKGMLCFSVVSWIL